MNVEWPSGATDAKFFVPHVAVRDIHNSVIDFDLDNLYQVLYPDHKNDVDKVADRVNKHYWASRTILKRAYGEKGKDDFQQYNWGLALSLEMGLQSDQAELLMIAYTRVAEGRLTLKEYDLIIVSHTSFKKIRKSSKRSKWRDLRTSWKIHAKKIKGLPLTISKKHFLKILEVNDIAFDTNMDRLSRDMMGFDYEADYLHMLLVDDPLLRGEVPPPRKRPLYFPRSRKQQDHDNDVNDDEYIHAFRKQMEQEAENFARDREQDMTLTKNFEKKIELEERLFLRRMQSEIARREAQYIANDDLSVKVRQIKQERQMEKDEAARKTKEGDTAELLKSTRSAPAIERTNSKLHIPHVSRTASKGISYHKSRDRKQTAATLSRAMSTIEGLPSDIATDEEPIALKKRDLTKLPRSSSMNTYGSHFAHKQWGGGSEDTEEDIFLPTLLDGDEFSVSSDGEEDDLAAALPAEAQMDEQAAQKVANTRASANKERSDKCMNDKVKTQGEEHAKEEMEAACAIETNTTIDKPKQVDVSMETSGAGNASPVGNKGFPERDATGDNYLNAIVDMPPDKEGLTDERGVCTRDDDSMGGGDEFYYDEDDEDEQYYMEEMSEVAVDILTYEMEDDLISLLSDMVIDCDAANSTNRCPEADVKSARITARSQIHSNRSDYHEDVDLMADTVVDIITDDVISSAVAMAVVEEALYLSEFQELDSVASEFSKYEVVASQAPVSAATPDLTRLELERLQRFRDVADKKKDEQRILNTPVMYAIYGNVQQPTYFPDLSDLFKLPYHDYLFNVPKTGNLLRVLIRHDDEGDRNGLFIHGFKSYSRAEEQGLLRVGDEVLAINDVDVEGHQLEAVIDALENHEDEFVRIVIRRREGLLNGDISPRSCISWNDQSISTQSSPRPFVISDQVHQPEVFPDFSELFALPSQDLLFRVPKTNGQLRVQLRYDDDGDAKGLFVHGFRPFSRAEEQGFLKVGDEVIEINGIDVEGAQLETVIHILMKGETDDYVDIIIRRRDKLEEILKYMPYFSPRAGGISPRGDQIIGRDGIDAINDMQWDDIAIDNDSCDSGLNVGEGAFSVTSSLGSGISVGIAMQDGYDSEIAIPNDSDSASPRLEEIVDEVDVEVPRTDGALRVLIRSIDSMVNSGFYVHGFKPMCMAEGVLRAGDVILEINGQTITGLLLKDVAVILDSVKGDTVPMKIRRSYVVKIRK